MPYTVQQLRHIEQQAHAAGLALMPRAGAAAADFIAARTQGPVLVLAGPGNNGGDALIAATLLRRRGIEVAVELPSGPDTLPPDAAAAWRGWQASGEAIAIQRPYAMVIDGLFGIGLNRPLGDDWQALIDRINDADLPTLSLDVPSGIHADTGAALGRPIRADWTLAFIGPARGLFTGAAVDAVGALSVAPLELSSALLGQPEVRDCADVVAGIRLDRPADSHKGRFGTLAVLGGAQGMVGAALLAGHAALLGGAGKVIAGLLADQTPPVDVSRLELMLRHADDALMQEADVLVAGPGLGRSAAAAALLAKALARDKPLLLDADALNMIAADIALRQAVCARRAITVVTPHPSEAARLLGCETSAIQADRYGAARRLSDELRAVVVLKGAGTIVDAGRRVAVNRSGSPALANAGQGDVLSGLIGALLAQGLDGWQAANLGVHVHGTASDALVAGDGRLATLASDVAQAAGRELGRLARR